MNLPLKQTKSPSLYCESKQETHNRILDQNNTFTTPRPRAKQQTYPSLHKSRSLLEEQEQKNKASKALVVYSRTTSYIRLFDKCSTRC